MTQDYFFQQVKIQFDSKRPFVIYKYPSESEVNALLQEDCKIYPIQSYNEIGFGVEGFTEEVIKFYYPLASCKQLYFDHSNFKDYHVKNTPYSTSQETKVFSSYLESLETIINETSNPNKSLDKVVLARAIDVDFQLDDLPSLIKKLIQDNTNSFCYCFYHPAIGLWMGATPEQLIEIINGEYTIMSLAGTKLKSENRAWTLKEVEEQKIVTEFIVDVMAPISDDLKLSDVIDKETGHIVHQLSTIEGVLKSKKGLMKSIISSLHPTPAVCGRPKMDAINLIKKLEPLKREYYSGYIGEMNMSKGLKRLNYYSFFVNLRCMQLYEDFVRIYVGGGITSESDAQMEWMETEHKSWTMKNLLFSN